MLSTTIHARESPTFARSRTSTPDDLVLDWQSELDVPFDESVRPKAACGAPSGDGHFVAAQTDSSEPVAKTLLTRVGADGSQGFTVPFSGYDQVFLSGLYPDRDEVLLVRIGENEERFWTKDALLFTWFDGDGRITREWRYRRGTINYLQAFHRVGDDRYLLASPSDVRMVTADNDIIWETDRITGGTAAEGGWIEGVQPLSDGFLFAGQTYDGDTGTDYVWTVTVGPDGSVGETSTFGALEWPILDAIERIDEETFLLVGHLNTDQENEVAAITADGDLRWQTGIDDIGGIQNVARLTRDGEAVFDVVGYSGAVRVTADGQVRDSWNYVPYGITPWAANVDADGSRVVVGTTEAQSAADVRAVALRPNRPPEAAFSVTPEAPAVGESVEFDPSASTDPDENVSEHRWNFGASSGLDSTERQPSHTYESPGTYEVTLTVVDAEGANSSTTRSLTVEAAPTSTAEPTATATETASGDPVPSETTEAGETANEDDGGLPGFGVGAALGGLAGLGALARRRLSDDDRAE